MSRRIIAFIVSLTVLCLNFVCVFASETDADGNIFNIVPDPAAGGIKVNGILNSGVDQANGLVVFRLIKIVDDAEIDVAVDFTKTKRSETGDIGFDFGTILLPEDMVTGDYIVQITGDNISKPYTYNYKYVTKSELLSILKTIENATLSTTDTITVASAYTEYNTKILGVDMTDYNTFDAAGRKGGGKAAFEAAYADIIEDTPFNLPESVLLPDETTAAQMIEEQAIFALNAHKEASAIGSFVEIENSTEVNDWYDKHYSFLGFDLEGTQEESNKITPILEDVKDSGDFVRRISEYSGTPSKQEVKNMLYESALLSSIVCAPTNTKVKNILNTFSYEPYFASIDWDGYNGIDSVKQAEIISEFAEVASEFSTCSDAVEYINEAIANPSDDDDDYDNDDGGSGNYGGPVGRPVYTEPPEAEKAISVFTDINDVDWAREAIEYLYENGVVNGIGNGCFAPDDNVTRAEFIKMIVVASQLNIDDASTPFKDVSADSWYAPYVAAAYRSEFVLGDENEFFHPDMPITRQDMVTILYRALGTAEKGEADFADAEKISDYAMDAVGYFYSKGIVNGVGEGLFSPLENATRAQTAVIIYRIMIM